MTFGESANRLSAVGRGLGVMAVVEYEGAPAVARARG